MEKVADTGAAPTAYTYLPVEHDCTSSSAPGDIWVSRVVAAATVAFDSDVVVYGWWLVMVVQSRPPLVVM